MGSKRTRNKPKEQEVVLTVFTNVAQDEAAYQLLQLFYKGALANEIGLMRALNNETHEEELVLVGVERNESGGLDTYPLATVITPDKAGNYFSPDGHGGWFEPGSAPDPAPMEV
jgi:hypothetical protein